MDKTASRSTVAVAVAVRIILSTMRPLRPSLSTFSMCEDFAATLQSVRLNRAYNSSVDAAYPPYLCVPGIPRPRCALSGTMYWLFRINRLLRIRWNATDDRKIAQSGYLVNQPQSMTRKDEHSDVNVVTFAPIPSSEPRIAPL